MERTQSFGTPRLRKTSPRHDLRNTILTFRLGVIVLATYWFSLFVGTHWPSGSAPFEDINDKLKHFVGFAGLTSLLCGVVHRVKATLWSTPFRITFTGFILLVYAIADEFTQRFVPGRTPDFWDVIADAAGILVVLAAYGIFLRVSTKRNPGESILCVPDSFGPTGQTLGESKAIRV